MGESLHCRGLNGRRDLVVNAIPAACLVVPPPHNCRISIVRKLGTLHNKMYPIRSSD